MSLNKSQFFGIFGSFMALGLSLSAGFADTNSASTPSPEAMLLAQTQAIQGSLQDQKAQDAVTAAVIDYVHQYDGAPISAQEQSDRFQKAMVAVGLTTPAQAATIMSSIESSSNQMVQGQISSDQFGQQIEQLAQLQSKGAQYSDAGRILAWSWVGGTAGGIGLAAYGFTSGHTGVGYAGIGVAVGVTAIFVYLAQGA
jgi:hypothetical protein